MVATAPAQHAHVSVGNLKAALLCFCFVLGLNFIICLVFVRNVNLVCFTPVLDPSLWTLKRHTNPRREAGTVDYSARHANVLLEATPVLFLLRRKWIGRAGFSVSLNKTA